MNGRWLVRLYPRAWRERYGQEFLALLEELSASPRVVLDALFGAADAHLRPQVASRSAGEEGAPKSATPLPAHAPTALAVEPPSALPARRRLTDREEFEGAIDQIIREARERGLFDNLAGAGKPLVLEDDAAAGDWAMAFRMLKSAGETLPWIALGQEVEADEKRLQAELARTAERLGRLRPRPEAYELERRHLRERYLEAAAALDKKLILYNAQVPSFRLDRGRLPRHAAEARFDRACRPATAETRPQG
jgi:hypothetical protein